MENNEEIRNKVAAEEYKLKQKDGKSIIWKYLFEIERDDGSILPEKVYCSICQKILKYSRYQTSNLFKHKCIHTFVDHKPVQINNSDKNACFDAFMNFTIEDCRPFAIVEGSGFQKMITKCIEIGAKYGQNIDVDHFMPSAATMWRRSKLLADEKKEQLKVHIQEKVSNGQASCTIDMWTDDIMKRSFLCATLHYEKNFHLIDITLGAKSMDSNASTASNISKKLTDLFEEFGVKDLSTMVFVTGGGGNIKNALKMYKRLNSSAHLFSNVLREAFDATKELNVIIKSCKETVKYLKKSNKQHMLETTLKNCGSTRLNPNLALFKSIFDNYTKINEILGDNTQRRNIPNIDIDVLQALVEMCNNFDRIFKTLLSAKSPTMCFVIPSINRIRKMCDILPNDRPEILALKENLALQLKKWTSSLDIIHKVALFLYPPAISMQPNDMKDIQEYCSKQLKDSTLSNTDQSIRPHSPPAKLPRIESPDKNVSFLFSELMDKTGTAFPTEKDEMERYCTEYVRLTEDFDVMEWWRNNASKYPKLSKLAASILSIPASSIASERVFSLAGNFINVKKPHLESKALDSILFLNCIMLEGNSILQGVQSESSELSETSEDVNQSQLSISNVTSLNDTVKDEPMK